MNFFNNLGMKNKLLVNFKDTNKKNFNSLGTKYGFFNNLWTKNELLKV